MICSSYNLLAGDDLGPLVFIPIVLGVGAIIAFAIYSSYKRRKALEAFALQHGLVFDKTKNRNIDSAFPMYKCFSTGHSRYGNNFLTGDWGGRNMQAFDYHYTTGSGKNQSHHTFSCVILWSNVPLKPLLIRPEHFFDKVGDFFGYNDIDFESAEFSKKFFVKAEDKKWAYDVIHTRAIEHLMANPKYSIQFDLAYVLIRKGQAIFKPEGFGEAANHITTLLDMMPDYLVKDLMGEST